MAWRRSQLTTEFELSRVQEKVENWSDELDGEHGLIQEFRTDKIERRTTVKNLQSVYKGGGIFLVAQLILEILRLLHILK